MASALCKVVKVSKEKSTECDALTAVQKLIKNLFVARLIRNSYAASFPVTSQ